ncbi:hypothetical protein COCSADRAFT_323657 [Bipolaris sorokiniana ND90Pr]|uniref:Uncharacterized protein n=1 Tax=Cochliobolus sativus (strain ND90Pr / ATCC 201652) TaxID=665912 RepID=M2SPR4_COCSN|nr:uncharacterized protein COCSADRAFT_323657 [Bipolaris sorokiniana ND90Pr]EMD64305.1 hypothetical protein COCSADRAFT_323657 [Bipolaris sorokiniana ND90Pr]
MKGPGSTVHYPLSWCSIRKRRDTATARGSLALAIGVTLESSILSSSNITRNFWYLHPHLHFGVHADVDCKCVAAALCTRKRERPEAAGAYTSFSSSFSLVFTWSFSYCNKAIRARCARPCQRQIRITRHLVTAILLSGVFDRLGLSFFVAIITLISLSRRIISNENTASTTPKAQILKEGNIPTFRAICSLSHKHLSTMWSCHKAEIECSGRCTRCIGSFSSDSCIIPICEGA